MEEVPATQQLFVLMDGVFGAYGGDVLKHNGNGLLIIAVDHDLSIVNTF